MVTKQPVFLFRPWACGWLWVCCQGPVSPDFSLWRQDLSRAELYFFYHKILFMSPLVAHQSGSQKSLPIISPHGYYSPSLVALLWLKEWLIIVIFYAWRLVKWKLIFNINTVCVNSVNVVFCWRLSKHIFYCGCKAPPDISSPDCKPLQNLSQSCVSAGLITGILRYCEEHFHLAGAVACSFESLSGCQACNNHLSDISKTWRGFCCSFSSMLCTCCCWFIGLQNL